MPEAGLPRHPEVSALSRAVEIASLVAAPLAALWLLQRLWPGMGPWTLPAVLAGIVAADFASGLVHWAADTWGRQDSPLVGERLIRPFRVHHANPRDLCARPFVDCNGDVASLTLPLLAWAAISDIEGAAAQRTAEFALAFCIAILPVNQVHKWAHLGSAAPCIVQLAQRAGLILSPRRHAVHHRAPFATDYCIVNGWCNPLLARAGFFRALERVVRRATGAAPRADERA
ncbi:MAG: fatty acid desaturase CarF family protein [Burkholderiales bacterium]